MYNSRVCVEALAGIGACVGVNEVMSRGSTSLSGVGAFICEATVSWVASNDSICNTLKYALVFFDMFRVFCRYNLNFS